MSKAAEVDRILVAALRRGISEQYRAARIVVLIVMELERRLEAAEESEQQKVANG